MHPSRRAHSIKIQCLPVVYTSRIPAKLLSFSKYRKNQKPRHVLYFTYALLEHSERTNLLFANKCTLLLRLHALAERSCAHVPSTMDHALEVTIRSYEIRRDTKKQVYLAWTSVFTFTRSLWSRCLGTQNKQWRRIYRKYEAKYTIYVRLCTWEEAVYGRKEQKR